MPGQKKRGTERRPSAQVRGRPQAYARTTQRKPSAPKTVAPAAAPRPPRNEPPSKEGISPLFLSALLFVPLAAAGLVISSIDTRYQGRVTYAVTPSTGNPLEAFDAYRRELIDTAWRTSATVDGAGQASPPAWTVEASPDGQRLMLSVTASSAEATGATLDSISAAFTDRLEQIRLRRSKALLAQDNAATGRREDILDRISEMRDHPQPGQSASRATQSPLVDNLLTRCDELAEQRQRYERLRRRLEAALKERRELANAPLPTAALIDPEARKRARAAEPVLQQDLLHLEVQLARLQAAALDVWHGASRKLEAVLSAAASLRALGSSPEAQAATPGQRLIIDKIVEDAAQHVRITDEFSRAWTRCFVDLESTRVDPSRREVLTIYEELIQHLQTYHDDASRSLSSLRMRTRSMQERAEEEARNHVLNAGVVRMLQRLEAAHDAFERAALGLRASHNYILDAALRSARGLTYRIESVSEAIEAELERNAVDRAQAERQTRIDTLSDIIHSIQTEIDNGLEGLLETQDEVRLAAAGIPALLDETMARGMTLGQENLLKNQLQRMQSASRESPDDSIPIEPDAVRLLDRQVHHRPTNISEIVSWGLFSWTAALFLLVGALRYTSA